MAAEWRRVAWRAKEFRGRMKITKARRPGAGVVRGECWGACWPAFPSQSESWQTIMSQRTQSMLDVWTLVKVRKRQQYRDRKGKASSSIERAGGAEDL